MNWWQQLLLILAGNLVAGVGVFLTLRSTIREAKAKALVQEGNIDKVDADASKTYAETSKIQAEQNKELMEDNRKLLGERNSFEKRLHKLEITVTELTRGVGILIDQLEKEHIEPSWTLAELSNLENK